MVGMTVTACLVLNSPVKPLLVLHIFGNGPVFMAIQA